MKPIIKEPIMNTLLLLQHPSTLVVLIVTMVAGLVLMIKPDTNDK